jgi:hypothetical protein
MITLAVEMNNVGVALMTVGRFQDALELFRGSMQIMETNLFTPSSNTSPGAASSAKGYRQQQQPSLEWDRGDDCARRAETVHTLSNNCRRLVLQYRQSLTSSSMKVMTRKNDDDQDVSRIYHALMISVHDESTLKEPRFTELWCAVIIFNCAVALQQQQMAEGLRKSEMLYRMAYDLAVASNARIRGDVHVEGADTELLSVRLSLGLLNNFSKLYYDLQHYAIARSVSNSLSNLICTLPQESATTAALMEEIRWLLLNCLLHGLSDPPTSPAA